MTTEEIKELPEFLFPDDMPLQERIDNITGLCDSYNEEEHQKKFTPEQKKRFKDELADISIELRAKENELKEIVKVHKAEMKPLVSEKNEILENLENGSVWTTETLYRIAVPEKGIVGVYDQTGTLQRIEKFKRGLQTTMKLVSKTGTDD